MSGSGGYLSGLAAEDIAARLYVAEGGRVLERRWRCPAGEIDLVVGFDELVVFVEVKARRHRDVAAGAISAAQWRRLGAAAELYLVQHPGREARFDVVVVGRDGRAERIENAASFDAW